MAPDIKERVGTAKSLIAKGASVKEALAKVSLSANHYYAFVNSRKKLKPSRRVQKVVSKDALDLRRFVSLLTPQQVIEIIRSH